MWSLIRVVAIFSLASTSDSTSKVPEYFTSLLSELANLSWRSIEDTIMISNHMDENDTVQVIRLIDKHFYLYFDQCLSNLKIPAELEEMKDIGFYSSGISLGMDYVLGIVKYHKENPGVSPEKLHAQIIIHEYLNRNPLQRIREMIITDNVLVEQMRPMQTSFIEKYKKFGDICLSKMSELQQIMTLFQLLRWIVTKLYTIAKLTIGIYLDFEQNESHTKVMESIMREYSVENMLKLCSDIIGAFKKDWEKISTAVYARDFDEYIVNGTFFEIKIFKRMFLEQCYALDLNPYPLDKKVTCSHVTSAHEMCPSLTPGNTCPVYFPCEKIFCEDLEEPTKVCKRNVPEGREYYYHLSSNEEDSRDCEDGSYWVHYKEWRDDNTACTPCKCICEKQDESSSKSYYYSTELSIANTANNMVVTGAKLEIINNTLVIVQQHGRLCPNGIICPNTTSWLSPKLVQKEKISLEEMNIVDLTRIVLGKDQVITGLSFQKGFGDPSIGHRIRLKVNANVFDFESGTLRDEQGLYFSESGASEVEPAEVISSSRQSSNIIIRDKFVKFTVSGGKTGGRITLPLIDARNVEPDPPTPLSGAGLYLRRKEDGSLIGLEVMTYNTKYLLFGKK